MTLHPCPHCGKTENDRDESTGMNAVETCNYPASKVACVQCHYCGLSGPLEDTVALAIAAWNSLPRRATTADDIIADLESRGLGRPCEGGDGYAACNMVLAYECTQCGRREAADDSRKASLEDKSAAQLLARVKEMLAL